MASISVVTISFNQAKFLPAALDSIHGQSGGPVEHIVVDPGSVDGSRDILAAAGPKVHAICEPDRGPADGLNKGFAAATGDILYFLNADDMVCAGAFAFARDFFDRHPDVDVLYGAGYIIDEHDRQTRFIRATHFSCRAYLYDAITLLQQSFFFRRAAFDKAGGFNIENRVSWDGELFFRMKMAGLKFHAVYAPLGLFRIYGGTITSSAGHQARRQKVRDGLALDYFGRPLSALDRGLRVGWMVAKQMSALLIYTRTWVQHRRALRACGLALPAFSSIWRV